MSGHSAGRRRLALTAIVCLASAALLTTGCEDRIERMIGSMSAQSLEAEYRVTDDPLLREWVETAGNTLLGSTQRQGIPYNFRVLETDLVNAFAAPWGYIYLTTGLMDFVDTQDEVWGVLGHEIGHVEHRHSIRAVKRGFMYNLGLALLGGRSDTLAEVAGIGLGLLSLRYSRDNEYEADDMGRILSYRAGYDPRGNADFFDRLMAKYEKRRPSSIEVMFRTHPPSADRSKRQRRMPELSDDNPDALLVTGRGYARRHETRRAEEMLARAARLRPEDAYTLTSLADVQMARGRHAEARETFQAAARARPTAYAEAGIRMAATAEPPAVQVASAAERAAAGALVADARVVVGQANIVASRAEQQGATIEAAIQPVVTGAHSIIDTLFALADVDSDMSSKVQGIATLANSAINRAIEPVYSLEVRREKLTETAAELRATAAEAVRKLAAARDGDALAGEVAVLERALGEARRALADVEAALAELQAAEPVVRAAQQSARETTTLLEKAMRSPRDAGPASLAESSAKTTEARAEAALAATRKAKVVSDRAALRALVARLNTAAVGAAPELHDNLDGLVAHYTLKRPRDVRALRSENIGYGDAALILAASRSMTTEPARLASLAATGSSLVDQVSSAGARTSGALLLLKYLATALEYETAG